MEKKKTAFCSRCNKDVSYHYAEVNHLKQFIFTVFSCGLWLPMWLMSFFPTKICDECDEAIWEE